MSALTDICDAVWTAGTRTLLDPGTPFGAPANPTQEICKTVWEYVTRTLTTAIAPTIAGPEFALPANRLGFTLPANSMQFTLPSNQVGFTVLPEE